MPLGSVTGKLTVKVYVKVQPPGRVKADAVNVLVAPAGGLTTAVRVTNAHAAGGARLKVIVGRGVFEKVASPAGKTGS